MNKNGVFFGVAAGMLLAMAATAEEVQMLRPEDEGLLETESIVQPVKISKPFYVKPARVTAMPSPEALDEQNSSEEIRDAERLPDMLARQKAEAQQETAADVKAANLRGMINSCLELRQERIELERDMYERLKTPESLAYLSETMQDVNLCYEDIGLEIIETYYDSDITELAKHQKISQTFYVNGTGLNFDPKFCGETCSMEAVLDAQTAKYADFRVYLTKLLDRRPQRN